MHKDNLTYFPTGSENRRVFFFYLLRFRSEEGDARMRAKSSFTKAHTHVLSIVKAEFCLERVFEGVDMIKGTLFFFKLF